MSVGPLRARQGRQVATSLTELSAEEAAKDMVGNILDSDSPMRFGSCATSEHVLEISLPGWGGTQLLRQNIGLLLGSGGVAR